MVCALSSRFRAQAFGDLTGGSRSDGVTIMKILRILQSSWRPGVCFFFLVDEALRCFKAIRDGGPVNQSQEQLHIIG